MKPRPFRESEWFSPGPGGAYPAALPGMICGVYAIRDAKTLAVLYVGESHTNRLKTTIVRHLAPWIDRGEAREWWPRHGVQIAWYAVPKAQVLDCEAWLIRHYVPRANTKGLEDENEWGAAPALQSEPGLQELPDWAELEGSAWIETAASDGLPF